MQHVIDRRGRVNYRRPTSESKHGMSSMSFADLPEISKMIPQVGRTRPRTSIARRWKRCDAVVTNLQDISTFVDCLWWLQVLCKANVQGSVAFRISLLLYILMKFLDAGHGKVQAWASTGQFCLKRPVVTFELSSVPATAFRPRPPQAACSLLLYSEAPEQWPPLANVCACWTRASTLS